MPSGTRCACLRACVSCLPLFLVCFIAPFWHFRYWIASSSSDWLGVVAKMHGLRHLLLLQCLLLPCSALLTVTVSSRPTTIVTRRAPLPELAAPRESKGQRRMSVFDAVAMVSGSAVGGGFLAVPDVTAPLGVLPSTVGLTLTWLFLVMAGLAYVEAAGAASGEGRGASILALS